MTELPQRKHPAHGVLYVANQPTIVFDTICTREPYAMARFECGSRIAFGSLDRALAWSVGRYIVMPDHSSPVRSCDRLRD